MAAELNSIQENDMNKNTSRSPAALVLVGMVSLLLTACGGGGGDSAPSTTATTTPTPTATAIITSLASIVAALDFRFSTAQQPASGITLARATGAALGTGVKLVLTGSTCVHDAVGTLTNPMATDSYISYPLTVTEASQTSAKFNLGAFQIPAAATEVLVTVIDGNSTLYSKRHSVASLANLSLVFPDEPPSSQETTYLDACN